ncbi:hypothetical protein ACLB2K_030705 [Fragaria x ananassa]
MDMVLDPVVDRNKWDRVGARVADKLALAWNKWDGVGARMEDKFALHGEYRGIQVGGSCGRKQDESLKWL